MGRDKYGNYVNEKGVTIKVEQDKNGKDHINFYDGPVDEKENHSAVHINVDYEKGDWNSKTHDKNHSNPGSGSGGCYLTSACMKKHAEQFDDNCYELKLLRWFRDNFVSKEDIDHYYDVAPIIVSNIDQQNDSNKIYKKIYENVICICVKAIEDKKYDMAYNIYKQNVLDLEKMYVVS